MRVAHYPADVSDELVGLKWPLGLSIHDDILYVVDCATQSIICRDLGGNTLVDPKKLTKTQIEQKLHRFGKWQVSYRKLKKADLKEKLILELQGQGDGQPIASTVHSSILNTDTINFHIYLSRPSYLCIDKVVAVGSLEGVVHIIEIDLDKKELTHLYQTDIKGKLIYGILFLDDIIWVTSSASGLYRMTYGDEKLDNVCHVYKSACHGLTENSVAPGNIVFTDLTSHSIKCLDTKSDTVTNILANGPAGRMAVKGKSRSQQVSQWSSTRCMSLTLLLLLYGEDGHKRRRTCDLP